MKGQEAECEAKKAAFDREMELIDRSNREVRRFEAAIAANASLLGVVTVDCNAPPDQKAGESLIEWAARMAVLSADALLAELDKKPEVEG